MRFLALIFDARGNRLLLLRLGKVIDTAATPEVLRAAIDRLPERASAARSLPRLRCDSRQPARLGLAIDRLEALAR